MSYAYTNMQKFPIGNGQYLSMGTFTDAAAAGSSIVTGLTKVNACWASSSAAIAALRIVESGTAGTLTIYATNDGTDDGFWFAIGR